jgi:hypothetical protein
VFKKADHGKFSDHDKVTGPPPWPPLIFRGWRPCPPFCGFDSKAGRLPKNPFNAEPIDSPPVNQETFCPWRATQLIGYLSAPNCGQS